MSLALIETRVIEPEILNPKDRVRISKGSYRGQSPFVEKTALAIELGRGRSTLESWALLLLENSPDFRKYYNPGDSWNDFQAYCLELIHEWRQSLKNPKSQTLLKKIPPGKYQEFVKENAHLFTLENYKNDITSNFKSGSAKPQQTA